MAPTFNGKPGDLIEIFRGPYQHWAVYIGENEVVHFTTDGGDSSGSLESLSSSTGNVKREKCVDVVGNHRYSINNLLDNSRKARDPSIIVEEACAMVGSELPYDVVSYNCEHFAIEMRYGKVESRQFNGKPGDLIEITRGPYKNWAIYIGGQEVVFLDTDGGDSSGLSTNSSSSTGKVKREKLAGLVGNDSYQINNLLDDMYEDRKLPVIVKEACAMVDSELPYDLVTYNCEHFATEMRYGKAESRQFKGNKGDLIEISSLGCKHWAIFIGGNEVIHLVTDGGDSSISFERPSSSAEVKREKLTDVVKDHHWRVNNLQEDGYKARRPSIIVKEACAMVGRELPYDLVTYNCEHFATEMRYGVAGSRQFKGKPGDLIEISRWGYQLWAVYIGKNEVVHFTTEGGQSSDSSANPGISNGKVKRQKLADVVGNDRHWVNNLLDEEYKARKPSVIVEESCGMVDSELQYDLVTYNSEHFATEMRYGKAESRQFHREPGDLIEISRRFYQHWAVYIGDNYVVHLVNEGVQSSGSSASSSNGNVKRDKFADVVGNHRYQVNNLLDKKYKAHESSVIVEEACAMVGDELPYNLVTYNCEHFATEMRYGKAKSRQVKKNTLISGVTVSTVGLGAGALFIGAPVLALGVTGAAVVGGGYAACKAPFGINRSSS